MNYIFTLLSIFTLLLSCENPVSEPMDMEPEIIVKAPFTILTLGDSYTFGQSVCLTCTFPYQLVDSLESQLKKSGSYVSIAQTGWTTTNLIDNIALQNPHDTFDIVTVLIGVNNQYQNKPFGIYEDEFPTLIEQAISFAQGDKKRVIIVSIPDYAFTPFGQNNSNPENISMQLDNYNAFAQNYAEENGITYVDITVITREGLDKPELVAPDGLHPSEIAYTEFVKKLIPFSKAILE